MENNEKINGSGSSWINASEMIKLDRSVPRDVSDFPSQVFENLSSNVNLSFNMSTTLNNLNHQSWITTASRIIPLYSVIFLLAVIGNSLVILTLVQNKRMRTITNLFLLNLAVSDLFLGVFWYVELSPFENENNKFLISACRLHSSECC